MNNLAPMKNCPGGVQGNLNWMPGFFVWDMYSEMALNEIRNNLAVIWL